MSLITLKSAWKFKIEPTNIFDNNFLKEKDSALQPIDFFFEDQILINNDNINNKNISINNEEIHKKNSIKESDIYDSNIIIIKEQSDEETEFTSFNNQLGKEIQKINSLMLPKIKTKKKNKISFKPIKY
jgi:hypothetical protein